MRNSGLILCLGCSGKAARQLIHFPMLKQFAAGIFALSCCLPSLAAPSSAWMPIPNKPDLQYLADSVYRIGDHVYLMHRGTSTLVQGVMRYEAPIEFNCSDRTFRTAWIDGTLDGKQLPRAYGTYGRASGRYTPAPFTPVQGTLSGAPFLDWACQLPIKPERLVNVRRGGGDKLIQIDTGNFSKTGTTASFWTRYDYPEIAFDPPYNAPYDSKREFVRVNCARKAYRITVGYDFTPEGAVTDGMIEPSDAETPFDSTDDYAIAINEVACGKPINPATYTGIGGEALRAKAPLPADLGIDDVANPPTVLATAAKLAAAMPASPTVSVAKFTLKRTGKFDEGYKSQTQFVIEPRKDGSTLVREIYRTFTAERDLVGIVQLKSKMHSDLADDRGVTVTQSLELDTLKWAPDAHFSYRSQMCTTPSTEKLSTVGKNCVVGQPIEAKQVHPAFSGQAWPLDCQGESGEHAKGYYIDELRYFISLRSESKDSGVWEYAIDDVSIQR